MLKEVLELLLSIPAAQSPPSSSGLHWQENLRIKPYAVPIIPTGLAATVRIVPAASADPPVAEHCCAVFPEAELVEQDMTAVPTLHSSVDVDGVTSERVH